MFSFENCASGCCALCSSISCERRRAQAIPAGPPPTMTTSAGISGCSTLGRGLRKINIWHFAFGSQLDTLYYRLLDRNLIEQIQRSGSGTDNCLQIRMAVGFFHFFVPGHCTGSLRRRIVVHAVLGAFAEQPATVCLQMSDEVGAFHDF